MHTQLSIRGIPKTFTTRGIPFGGRPLRRLAIVRAVGLVEMMAAVPALRALRAALPNTEITLIGRPWASEFAEQFSKYVDRFREFPSRSGDRLSSFLQEIEACDFDFVLQMQGNDPGVNAVFEQMQGRESGGFYPEQDFCPNPELFLPTPEHGLETHRLLNLMTFLGVPVVSDGIEFPLRSADLESSRRLLSCAGLRLGRYVCIRVTSNDDSSWSQKRFAAVGNALATTGLHLVLVGSERNGPAGDKLAAQLERPPVNLVGLTSLGTTGALIGEARLLLSDDIGMSQIAAAVHTPSLLIADDDSARWWAANARHHRKFGHSACAWEVTQAARELLSAHEPAMAAHQRSKPPTRHPRAGLERLFT